MRHSLRVFALAIALAVSLLAVAPPARANMGVPTWSAGDFLAYAVTGQNLGLSGSGSMQMDVVGPDTANVAGTDYTSYRVRLSLNVSGGATFNSGDSWYRASDLALVKQTCKEAAIAHASVHASSIEEFKP